MQQPTVTTTLSHWQELNGLAGASQDLFRQLESAGKLTKKEVTEDMTVEEAQSIRREVVWDDEIKKIFEDWVQ